MARRAAALLAVLCVLAVLAAAPRAHALGSAESGDLSLNATGSVRLLAGFLHYPDEPAVYPSGDDGLAAGVVRLVLDGGLTRGVDYEVNVFSDLSRLPSLARGGGLLAAGSFSTAGSFESPYRTPYLAWSYWRSGSTTGQLGVDRLSVKLHEGRYSITFGRFPINHSVTQIFTPNDFFAPFTATAINRVYKPGVDAVRVGVSLGELSMLEADAVIGSDADGAPSWQRSAALLRASTVLWKIEWAGLAGRLAGRWVVGGSLQGSIGPVGVRAEGHAGFPDRLASGQLDGPVHGRVAAGLSKEFIWHNSSVGAEYLFQSDGGAAPAEYLGRMGRLFPDDQPYLGQHYVGVRLGGEIVPVLKVNAVALLNAADGSGLVLGSLLYDISDEASFIGGVIVPWGARLAQGGVAPALGSEFGLTPLSAFLEMRFYF